MGLISVDSISPSCTRNIHVGSLMLLQPAWDSSRYACVHVQVAPAVKAPPTKPLHCSSSSSSACDTAGANQQRLSAKDAGILAVTRCWLLLFALSTALSAANGSPQNHASSALLHTSLSCWWLAPCLQTAPGAAAAPSATFFPVHFALEHALSCELCMW